MNDPDVERVERDQIVCVDIENGGDPDPTPSPSPQPGRKRRSFDPTELTWNIDRLDERSLPLDGQFCPAAPGTCMQNNEIVLFFIFYCINTAQLFSAQSCACNVSAYGRFYCKLSNFCIYTACYSRCPYIATYLLYTYFSFI